jgi:hypothetical protein
MNATENIAVQSLDLSSQKGAKIKYTKQQNRHTVVPSALYTAKGVDIFKNSPQNV